MRDAIISSVVAAAADVPGELLEFGALAIEARPEWSRSAADALISASPAAHYRHHAERVARAWSAAPGTAGAVVAAGLRAARAAVAAERAMSKVNLVWTGPSSEVLGFRSTRAVASELVAHATDTLVLVSFASYNVDELAAALETATARGVDVSMILETPDEPGAELTIDASHAFARLKGHARFYRWPLGAREAYFAASAKLHAKCIVADRSLALISSANLTGAGINDNIELGVLIEAGPLPAKLHDHFSSLIEMGVLELAG